MAIEIVDFPINSMVIFHIVMLVYQRVFQFHGHVLKVSTNGWIIYSKLMWDSLNAIYHLGRFESHPSHSPCRKPRLDVVVDGSIHLGKIQLWGKYIDRRMGYNIKYILYILYIYVCILYIYTIYTIYINMYIYISIYSNMKLYKL